jgi:hypothetical protein
MWTQIKAQSEKGDGAFRNVHTKSQLVSKRGSVPAAAIPW